MSALVAALLLGFALGSVPFGLLLTRAAGLGDLRAIGSGNIGATNVLRTGRKGLAAATLLLDALKGLAAVWLAERLLGSDLGVASAAALGAVLGHCYPPWLGFRGGKGVATALGAFLGLAWPLFLSAALVWLAAAKVTRISSASALSGLAVAPLAALAWGGWRLALPTLLIALVVLHRHRDNLRRLRAGTEPRIGEGPVGKDG